MPEAVCPHKNTLDDYETADVVCMDCGLVLDRLIGYHSGGGGRMMWRGNVSGRMEEEEEEEGRPLFPFVDLSQLSAEERRRRRARESIISYLSVFHMDSEEVVNAVLQNYWKIYGGRENGRKGFRKNDYKERVALGFSICNTLAREGIPRPPDYIARLCNVNRRAFLNLPSILALDSEELGRLRRRDYELKESEAEDYIDTLCSFLGVPFHLAGRIVETARKATEALHGCYPTVLAAASMQLELQREGLLETRVRGRDICELLQCQQKTVAKAIARFREHYDEERRTEERKTAAGSSSGGCIRRARLRHDARRASQNGATKHSGRQIGRRFAPQNGADKKREGGAQRRHIDVRDEIEERKTRIVESQEACKALKIIAGLLQTWAAEGGGGEEEEGDGGT